MGRSAFAGQRSKYYKYKLFIFVHTSGTFQLSDYLSDFFEKNKNVCAFCTAHIFEALFWKNNFGHVKVDCLSFQTHSQDFSRDVFLRLCNSLKMRGQGGSICAHFEIFEFFLKFLNFFFFWKFWNLFWKDLNYEQNIKKTCRKVRLDAKGRKMANINFWFSCTFELSDHLSHFWNIYLCAFFYRTPAPLYPPPPCPHIFVKHFENFVFLWL